jgi:succinate dehydrogenase / fumarate reductase cytochrome b subunit
MPPIPQEGTTPVSTAAVAPDYAVHDLGGRYTFLLRRLHSLTGLLFGGYLIVHLLINATLVEGVRSGFSQSYQVQVDKIHSLPFLPLVEWTLIYLPILFHMFYGIWIVATGQPNATRYGYGRNWLYVFQRISSIVLVLFIAFHVLGMKGEFGGDVGKALTFVPAGYATQSAARHVNAAWWVWSIVYPIGILAACYHLSNGFWTAGITWGLTVSAAAMRRWGAVCVGIFVFSLGCGMTALVSLVMMGSPPAGSIPAADAPHVGYEVRPGVNQ